ncbi:hypothetical protein GGG87_00540 [Streptococcus sp. zg-86]|uniref:Uncharacterized protein n=1 Tax=Streptococcus zhangguiae TaxID=2664091 RepID=A0A6I4RD78_9STRE|nr:MULTISPECIES: hypothetical protein [unclassified Streptococcus]MTB63498.1 hypothetical protein [Streptococcus sp. zg-86]MTB89853.1 hypothetical protein [Streptococcus sp. zg-36]MWV55524.1 hypothetical protein [Streptococcus sp. zg-70]QTH47714.1 hypothetical protein J5M87_09295 [Streptococcus sp. zg-86]
MKKELFYYWEHFCLLNALLCGALALTMLIFPHIQPTLHFSSFVNFFTFPLVLNRKMKTKLRYRFFIAISLIFILEPIWNLISTEPIQPTPLIYFLSSLVLSLLALGNYLYLKRS